MNLFLTVGPLGHEIEKRICSCTIEKRACLDNTFSLSPLSLFYTLTFQIAWKQILPSVMSGGACEAQDCILGPRFYQPGMRWRNVIFIGLGDSEKENLNLFKLPQDFSQDWEV